MQTCTLHTKKPVIPNVIVRLVQRVRPTPIKNTDVRYDPTKNMWSIIDLKEMKLKQHFYIGIMENVNFRAVPMDASMAFFCNPGTFNNIGIANGDLYLHQSSDDIVGAKNFSFNGDNFINEDGEILTTASKVILMRDRRGLYFK
jgi:hypothetical protein